MLRLTVYIAVMAAMLFCATTSSFAAPENFKIMDLEDEAPDFKLPGVDGKTYELKDFADAKVLMVVFTCNHCPTSQAYEERLMKMHEKYKDKGVSLVAISSNDPKALRLDEMGFSEVGDSFDDMKIRAKDRGFKFPYLYDGDKQEVGAAYGAMATPHVFIFDKDRKLQYTGRIDDADVGMVRSPDAVNAIEALLAGQEVEIPMTRIFGCSTKWSDKRKMVEESIKYWNTEPVGVEKIDEEGVKELAANQMRRLRLVNVWATWCGPCIQELPELVAINRMYRRRGLELVTISLDGPDKEEQVLKILEDNHVAATNYMFDGTEAAKDEPEKDESKKDAAAKGDAEKTEKEEPKKDKPSEKKPANWDKLAEALDKEWKGPVPYTILIAPGGKILYRKHDVIDPLELRKAIVEYLGRTYR